MGGKGRLGLQIISLGGGVHSRVLEGGSRGAGDGVGGQGWTRVGGSAQGEEALS